MFHYDRGLKLTKADLAIDFRRRQPRAFISHAHSDHMARHEYALCTPETSALYKLRYGARPTHALPYRQTQEWGGLRLTTYPAGHCLGSAMLLVEDGETSLLYTGDFKLGESATAERAELPHADVLVIESTYGNPFYRHPPRAQVLEQLFSLIADVLRRGQTPVVEAYILGKSQEVSKLLTTAGFRVLQHPKIFAVSEVYRASGVEMGDCREYDRQPEPGCVVITPPRMHRHGRLPGLKDTVTFAVTGWATHERTRGRLGVDHAIPLSDHADFDELLEAVRRVAPQVVYCTHGPKSFVNILRDAGHQAFPLDEGWREPAAQVQVQLPLFQQTRITFNLFGEFAMTIGQSMLPEFDHEMANTRKVLALVPDDKLNWKAHPKMNTIGWVAAHLSNIPSWVGMTFEGNSLDIAPGGVPMRTPPADSTRQVLENFDKNVSAARKVLEGASDAAVFEPWTLVSNGQAMFTVPRIAVVRNWVLNHSIHHRAHLCVYLRLNDVPVPGMYGPSADA